MTQKPINWPVLADLHTYYPVAGGDYILVQVTPDTSSLFLRIAELGLDESGVLPCANGNKLIALNLSSFNQIRLCSLDGESPNDTINRLCREYLGDRPH